MQEAGANQALELAFTLAVREYEDRHCQGHGCERLCWAPVISRAIGMNFYLEVAKMRAARLLWCRIMKGFGAKVPKEPDVAHPLPDQRLESDRTRPYNNIVRTTIEAMAMAVFGGTQSLHTNSFDEAIALPTEFSARIARNTQLIIQEETHITSVIDPLGDSYMMEKLTQDMADAAWSIIEEVDAMGGMTWRWTWLGPSSRSRLLQPKNKRAADSGQDVIVGVNKYKLASEGTR